MKRNCHHFAMAVLTFGMFATVASCKKNNNNYGTTTPPSPGAEVQFTENAQFGEVITDSAG
jgi:hypothetical protein